MRRHFATIAAIGMSAMLSAATLAFAQDEVSQNFDNFDLGSDNANNENNITNDLAPGLQDILPFPKLGPKAAILDLGIDLTDVALTPQGVTTFLASLDPQAQMILVNSCAHYLDTPASAQSNYTLQFCQTLIGG
jgi:hypothetical protein